MTDFNLTSTGLGTDTEEEIQAAYTQALRGLFGAGVNTTPKSIMGQWVGISSEVLAIVQQTALQVYQSFDPSNATGVSLAQRGALTGSLFEGASVSVVTGTLEFAGAGTANNGDLIENTGTGTQWQLIDGPHVAVGPDSIDATFAAVETGPITGNANTVWGIITAIPGIDDPPYLNPTDDAALGADKQTDPEFRATRQVEMFSQNIGGRLAISGAVSKVSGVVDARCYHNPTVNPVDSEGIPFKAFNVVVDTNPTPPTVGGALEQSIFDAILTVFGAGGESFATLSGRSGFATDAEGVAQPVGFDLVTLKSIYVDVAISTAGTTEPVSTNLADVIQTEIAARASVDFTSIGEDALTYRIQGIVADLSAEGEISGVVTSVVQLSEVATVGPFVDPVPVGIRERPDYNTVNVLVTVTP